MSIRAMNWAMGARTDGVSAQCVLFVVADTANEHGVSVHADPDYIAERTRQSRATVFRRLKELEQAGALTRLKRYRDDGAPVYEIRLHLTADIDYEAPPEGDDGTSQDIEAESQIETPPKSQIATPKVAPVRQAESHSCDYKNPSKNPEDPPNPPLGGDRAVVDQDFEDDIGEFIREYPAPITNLPVLRNVLAAMARSERRKVITAGRGYASYIRDCDRRGKPRAVKDAHRWVAGGQWQGYLPAGEKAVVAAMMQRVAIDSKIGKAWAVLHRIAHVRPLEGAGHFIIPRPLTEQAAAFADAPPESDWVFIGSDQINQCGAWRSLLAEVLAGIARPELVWERGGKRGFSAPWPWPPRKDGSVSTGPPSDSP